MQFLLSEKGQSVNTSMMFTASNMPRLVRFKFLITALTNLSEKRLENEAVPEPLRRRPLRLKERSKVRRDLSQAAELAL